MSSVRKRVVARNAAASRCVPCPCAVPTPHLAQLGNPPLLRRLLREPLFHFMLIGAAILAAYPVVNTAPPSPTPDEIVVTSDTEQQLSERFRAVWMRPPAPEELDSLVEEYVREEVLVREALKLSMDRDDAVVRQRLAQKMRFLLESSAGSVVPTEAELRDFLRENASDYERGARLAFHQVFLGEDPSSAEVENALAALRAGTDPAEIGQGTLLPGSMPLAGSQPVNGTFGDGFFQRLATVDPGVWTGPISSGYGTHLVRVTETEPGGMPAFADVRGAVEDGWRREKAAQLLDTQYQRLAAEYTIVLPAAGDPAGEQ